MNTRILPVLAGALTATCAFGQLVAIGENTGVTTLFYASVVDQDLFITVENTTEGATGQKGTVTSFGFNTPWAAALDLSKVSISFQNISATGSTSAWNPLSKYTLSAGIGGGGTTVDFGIESDHNNNPDGGNPNNGVEFGETVKFKFSFDASVYDIPNPQNVADFFNQEQTGENLLVRWQNVNTGSGSDAFAGNFPDDDPQGEVPEPGTYGVLGAAALLGATLVRRLRRPSPRAS